MRLFGSRARGTAMPGSDLDLLVVVPDAWLASQADQALLECPFLRQDCPSAMPPCR